MTGYWHPCQYDGLFSAGNHFAIYCPALSWQPVKGLLTETFIHKKKHQRHNAFFSSCPSCLRGDNFLRLVQNAGNAYSRFRSKSLIPACLFKGRSYSQRLLFTKKTPRTQRFFSSCPWCLRGDNFLRIYQELIYKIIILQLLFYSQFFDFTGQGISAVTQKNCRFVALAPGKV